MQAQTLVASVRPEAGKQAARRLRRQGQLPGVIYGKKAGSIPLTLPLKELERILARDGENALLKVVVTDQGADREFMAVIRGTQRHPIKGVLTHADLYQVSMEEKLRATLPVILEGEPQGIKEGGILQHGLREVEVESLPGDLPESLAVDIRGLSVGGHLTVADLKTPPGVKVLTAPEAVVATVVTSRAVETETGGAGEPAVAETPPTVEENK